MSLSLLLSAVLLAPVLAGGPDNPWSKAESPAAGPAEAVGDYSAGCLRGAEALPAAAEYQIMRPSRHRNFGHPDLLRFIEDVSRRAKAAGFGPLLVGDMSQPRGGPAFSGHASHQNGLDADFWYWQPRPGKRLSRRKREKLSARKLVVPDFKRLDRKAWKPKVVDLLKLVAEEPRTQRILVNPVIKREVCMRHRGEAWVHKLRPWYGHDDHFHVRLQCPAGNALCKPQEEAPAGDGCDASLDEWFTAASRAKAAALRSSPGEPKMPSLPEACEGILKQ